jgi:hypothetical protein
VLLAPEEQDETQLAENYPDRHHYVDGLTDLFASGDKCVGELNRSRASHPSRSSW